MQQHQERVDRWRTYTVGRLRCVDLNNLDSFSYGGVVVARQKLDVLAEESGKRYVQLALEGMSLAERVRELGRSPQYNHGGLEPVKDLLRQVLGTNTRFETWVLNAAYLDNEIAWLRGFITYEHEALAEYREQLPQLFPKVACVQTTD